MGRWIFNSALVVVLAVLGKLILASTAAYAFARLRFPGRDWIFYVFLTALMIPWEVTLIPGFVLMRQFGWIDTPAALIIPSIGDVFGIFLLRQYFMAIPRGAGRLCSSRRRRLLPHLLVDRAAAVPSAAGRGLGARDSWACGTRSSGRWS